MVLFTNRIFINQVIACLSKHYSAVPGSSHSWIMEPVPRKSLNFSGLFEGRNSQLIYITERFSLTKLKKHFDFCTLESKLKDLPIITICMALSSRLFGSENLWRPSRNGILGRNLWRSIGTYLGSSLDISISSQKKDSTCKGWIKVAFIRLS